MPQPPFVLLLGETGAGKSTFVNTCIPGARAPTSDSLASDTKSPTIYPSEGQEFILVDTPGFNDSHWISDEEVLQRIVKWVRENGGNTRCGILFLQERDNGPVGGNLTLVFLKNAMRIKKAFHQITTFSNQNGLSYNGKPFTGELEARSFCQDTVKETLKNGLDAQNLLEELERVLAKRFRKEPLHPPSERLISCGLQLQAFFNTVLRILRRLLKK